MKFLLLALWLVSAAPQGDAWAQLWTELENLRGGKVSRGEASVFQAHLSEALRQSAPSPRTELLRACMEALAGRDASAVAQRLAALDPSPFTARESWFLADLLPPSPERAGMVLTALEASSTVSEWQALLAWNVAVDEARTLNLQNASLPIQAKLHERFAAPWSAEDLAKTLRALGDQEAADRVLEGTIRQEQEAGRRPMSLWRARALIALGFGDETTARDYLGKAHALGSDDAGLVLARLDLEADRIDSARAGFRALLINQPPQDWAWRGWGTTLLPSHFAASATSTPLPSNE